MRSLTERAWLWLPDMAANLLLVSLLVLALQLFLPEDRAEAPGLHRQVPQGGPALVEALWLRLHPEAAGRAIYDLDRDGLHALSQAGEEGGGEAPALVFVLSQSGYPQALTALQARGGPWIEISVPQALAAPEGWRAGFLDLGRAPAREGFELRLARLLNQGAGAVVPRSDTGLRPPAAEPAWHGWALALRRLGNCLAFGLGAGLLLWLWRRQSR